MKENDNVHWATPTAFLKYNSLIIFLHQQKRPTTRELRGLSVQLISGLQHVIEAWSYDFP